LIPWLAVAAIFAAPVAFATDNPGVSDVRGDSTQGYPDIESASVAVDAETVTWTVTAYNAFALAKAPCIVIKSFQPAGAQWLVCGTANKGFGFSSSGVFGRGGGFAGTAVVSRLKGRPSTVVYEVPRKYLVIEQAHKGLVWYAESLGSPTTHVLDQAPDGAGVKLPFG
jgi:hypothetical protein